IKSSQRARELVRQILTFSRQSEMERKPLKIQYVINEALNLIRSSLPSTIKIVKNIDKECEPVMADPTQVHQVIMNLCTNAYHAMGSADGVLKVTLDTIDTNNTKKLLPDMLAGVYLKIRVSDTGCGITPNTIKQIFDPYFTTKERGKGTGLGLSIVHGIVKKHEGYISVQSEVDKGTEFNVYLPVIKIDSHIKKPKMYHPACISGHERILLVDDEQQIIQMLQKVLTDLGYNVRARTSSIEALHAFRANPDNFDIVVTDQTMPNMTGETLAKELMLVCPDIPVILCTGFSEVITREKIKEIGIRELVMKPVVTSEIAGVIRHVLDNPAGDLTNT
ncbi:ATP-binding protein, partial [Desulfobacterales bacterium HSG17]|nr:ATP-binding protein [Desulfobacterales bacterium HSG17]